MAYVPVQYAGPDEVVAVEIRGQLVKGRVVPLPFYKRPKKTA
jgi:aminomethyltransferase